MSRSDRSCGPGSALPSRRTLATAFLAFARSMLATLRHPVFACQQGRLHWQGQPLAISMSSAILSTAIGGALGSTALAEPPARLAQVPAVPMADVHVVESTPSAAAIPPRNTGPQAMAHSRYRRGRHGTTRIIRRTPAVMREDAARVKRGDLFSTWSNEYLE